MKEEDQTNPASRAAYPVEMIRKTAVFASALAILFACISVASAAAREIQTVADLKAIEGEVAKVAAKAMDATVALVSEETGSSGSGVVTSADGLILTAAHVVQGLDEISVVFPNGKRARGHVLGSNLSKDIAMVQMDDLGPWAHVELGDSRTLVAGNWLVAMGHSTGFDPNRTPPVRFGRVISKGPGNYFTSDCTLIGGDSGGPIFDLTGKLVGINSSIGESKRNNNHAGVDGFREDWDRLMGGETWGELSMNPFANPETPVLGIGMGLERRGVSGVPVERITPNSPAAAAGVRIGDLLVEVDGVPITNGRALQLLLAKRVAGEKIQIGLLRDSTRLDLEIVLVKREVLFDRRSLSNIGFDPEIFGGNRDVPLLLPGENEIVTSQYENLYAIATEVAGRFKTSTVLVYTGESQAAYGTVVGDGKQVLTKWSEIAGRPGKLQIVDHEENVRPASITGVYEEDDVAVLSIGGDSLVPVEWSTEEKQSLGEFLIATRRDGKAGGIGVISVLPRSLRESDQAFLGVAGDPTFNGPGVRVGSIEPDTGAFRAGLKAGDVILEIAGKPLSGLMELRIALVDKKPGDLVPMKILREGNEISVDVLLGERPLIPQMLNPRLRLMEQMGGNVSRVRDRFPRVLQADLQLQPERCGGPVIDLDGKVIGMAIAQADRTRSFVIPASRIVQILGGTAVDPTVAKVDLPSASGEIGHSGPMLPPMLDLREIERAQRNVTDMKRLIERLHEEMDAIGEGE